MPKGQFVNSVQNAKVDPKRVEEFLENSKHAEHTKAAIRMVLIDRTGLREPSEKFGISRQLIHRRCKDVLERLGVELSIEAQVRAKA